MGVQVRGISALIDSCSGLIVQQANKAYVRLPEQHKRWVDPEDLLQQALLESVRAQKRYRKRLGAKFSTYLYKGLQFELAKTYTERLRMPKRNALGIVELDAPISTESETTAELPSTGMLIDARRDLTRRAVHGFLALCQLVGNETRLLLIRGLLCGGVLSNEELSAIASEVPKSIATLGLAWTDFDVFLTDEKIRKITLIEGTRRGMFNSNGSDEIRKTTSQLSLLRVLECVECTGRFQLAAIQEGNYVVSTMTCSACYKKMQKSSASCFGKPKGKHTEGYSVQDVECRLHCKDKIICRKLVEKGDKKIMKFATKSKKAVVEDDDDELDGVDLSDVDQPEDEDEDDDAGEDEAPAKPAKSKKSAKPVKAEKAKPVKAAAKVKKEKVDDDPAPEDIGGRWPFRAGMMRWMFQAGLKGISRKEFDAKLTAQGRNPTAWLKILQQEKNGVKRGNTTHTWKLDEAGGRLKIHGVKFVGEREKATKAPTKAAAKPAAKPVAKKKKAA